MYASLMDRRSLIIGGAALIAAPAIVKISSLMSVKPIREPTLWTPTHWWGKFEPLEAQIGDLWDHVGGGGITTYRCHRVIDCLTEPVKDGRMWSQRLWVSSDGKEEQKGWAWIDAA